MLQNSPALFSLLSCRTFTVLICRIAILFAINPLIPPVAKANPESASVYPQDLSLEINSIQKLAVN